MEPCQGRGRVGGEKPTDVAAAAANYALPRGTEPDRASGTHCVQAPPHSAPPAPRSVPVLFQISLTFVFPHQMHPNIQDQPPVAVRTLCPARAGLSARTRALTLPPDEMFPRPLSLVLTQRGGHGRNRGSFHVTDAGHRLCDLPKGGHVAGPQLRLARVPSSSSFPLTPSLVQANLLRNFFSIWCPAQ